MLFFSSSASAQDFNYVHYDTKDGLAGSTVYDMCQDKDGFIWFATENGLSRYDGTHFRNFTVKDGLPDNEVLKIFADSKGRLWIGTFAKELCYYKNGKIYNKKNSRLVSGFSFKGAVLNIFEDEKGFLMVGDRQVVYEISPDDKIQPVVDAQMAGSGHSKRYAVAYYKYEGFVIHSDDSAFKFKNGKLEFQYETRPFKSDRFFSLRHLDKGKFTILEAPDARINQTYSHFTCIYVSTANGAWSIDTIANVLQTHFLSGKRISNTINDAEGNIWFTTLGEGVYKLPSTETKTIGFAKAGNTDNMEVFSLSRFQQNIIAGLGFSKAAIVVGDIGIKVLDYERFTGRSINNLSTNRLYCSKELSGGKSVILGFDAYLASIDGDGKTLVNSKIVAIKSIDEIDSQHVLVGMYSHAVRVNSRNLNIVDTVWTGRCTKVLYNQCKYYIGTINGLFEVNNNKTYKFLGDLHASLKRRIADMKALPEGSLWIATNDKGLVAYKNGKIITEITDKDGLSSNICKSLYIDGQYLWVGTNKGLNRIDIKNYQGENSIVSYSSSDGLPSDIINALHVKDSIIWVGSPAGLTYFNEQKISHTSLCRLRLLSVAVSSKELDAANSYNLVYKDNNIKFEFVAISFKSAGDIVYHYKLQGLDTGWQQTRETSLDYPSLPSGDYKLQLYAVNKFGVKSVIQEVSFSIAAPFWRKWWFSTLVLLTAVTITILLVNGRSKVLRQRLIEKSNFQKQFAALEQQALQAQMNPHFIFNCLNSIQQYILTNDKEKANEYLTGFATLIRQTLDNSGKKSITVAEEIRYLTSYLDMEQMRFGDNFIYEIEIDNSMQYDFIEMPALLLQPYVENSLRHGIRYKEHGIGIVNIRFKFDNEVLYCRIEDNGIGRKRAGEFKSSMHIEYQSKGMSLTEKRIELLNTANERKITIEIVDLEDNDGNATGTSVTVKIPT